MSDSIIRARIDSGVKAEATAVLAGLGLTVSEAVRQMLDRVARDKALPFEAKHPMDDFEPGPITRAAMVRANNDELTEVSSFKALLAEIDAED